MTEDIVDEAFDFFW